LRNHLPEQDCLQFQTGTAQSSRLDPDYTPHIKLQTVTVFKSEQTLLTKQTLIQTIDHAVDSRLSSIPNRYFSVIKLKTRRSFRWQTPH